MNENWLQILTLLIANFTIIWWFRKESREDWLRCQNTIDSIKMEIQDFHERLLKIEMDRN